MADKNLTQVESVFHAALDVPVAERRDYVEQACDGDAALLAEVSSLLSSVESSNGFMEQPLINDGLKVLVSTAKESVIGKLFGVYRIVAPLGQGGMGDVYLAEDTRLNRNVALKFLSAELVGDNWAKRQLRKEAQSVAMLDHPNICQVYGIADDASFIVMQYVKGTTLAELIRTRSLAIEEILSLAKQIVGALAEAHAHGIIHRDIKPKNIMVTANQQVKVLDFGLAKTVQRLKECEADDSVSNISQIGQLGTVPYMSPEQLREERLDYRSDVFSAGIVLYEMLCGKNPFARDNCAETISAILSTDPAPFDASACQKSKALQRIVSRCLAKPAEDRYQSATDLLIDLEAIGTKGVDVHSEPPVPKSRTVLRAALGLSILILLAFVSYFIYVSATRTKSVAVLPIENQTGDRNLDFMGDGLTDTITTKLSRLSKLNVLPATVAAASYKRTKDVKQIARELKLDSVLTATIVGNNERQFLQAKLLNGENGATLWEQQYPLEMANVITVEANISQKVI